MRCLICGARAEVVLGGSLRYSGKHRASCSTTWRSLSTIHGPGGCVGRYTENGAAGYLCRACYSQLTEHRQAIEGLAERQQEREA